MIVIGVGSLAVMFTRWNKKAYNELVGKEVLIVNEKRKTIVGLIKFLEPPKKYTETYIYKKEVGNV